MRKGFKSLLTVAVALLGLKAMAMAPTVSAIPDVIIGDAETGSGANKFVYPNAINLKNLVTDDSTSAGAIAWTFSNPGGHYVLNAHSSIQVGTPDLINPDAAHNIVTGSDDADSTDSDLFTVTFRNTNVSPLPAAASYPDPGASYPAGVVTDGQAVTLIASDGSTTSQKSFMAYTVNDGNDALSGGGGAHVQAYTNDFTTGSNGWIHYTAVPGLDTAVTLTNGSNGLCADAAAQGANINGWASQATYTGANATYNTVSLVDNAVYRTRMTVSTTAQAGLTPLWYISADNSLSWYGDTFIFFDNGVNPNAGANAPASGAGSVMECWINAPAEGTASFKAAIANAANATFKDFRLILQILDVGSTGSDPYGAASDAGAVCWHNITLDRFDVGSMVVTSTPYSATSLTQPTQGAAGVAPPAGNLNGPQSVANYTGSGLSTVNYTGGHIVIQPTSTTAFENNASAFDTTPGDTQLNIVQGGGADLADNYIVQWNANQLYRIVYNLQAPDAASETGPLDYLFINGQVITNELLSNVFVTNKVSAAAMPKQTAADYYSFWFGNNGTTATGNYAKMRPDFFCGTTGGGASGSFHDVANTGGIQINSCRVEMVHF